MYPIPKFADFSPTKCLEILRYFRDFMLNNENFGVKMKKKRRHYMGSIRQGMQICKINLVKSLGKNIQWYMYKEAT